MKQNRRRRNTVRIIGGRFRSRLLRFPDGEGLRPTPDRIRETLFNWLRAEVPGATCLDLFAGSGALGFEALSRGAARVIMVERNSAACAALAENARLLGAENAQIHCLPAWDWLRQTAEQPAAFELVFLDPPFASGLLPQACESLEHSGLLAPGACIHLESEAEIPPQRLPDNWTVEKSAKAGDVRHHLARRA